MQTLTVDSELAEVPTSPPTPKLSEAADSPTLGLREEVASPYTVLVLFNFCDNIITRIESKANACLSRTLSFII